MKKFQCGLLVAQQRQEQDSSQNGVIAVSCLVLVLQRYVHSNVWNSRVRVFDVFSWRSFRDNIYLTSFTYKDV